MSETNAIMPEQINYAVQCLRKFPIAEIGSDSWLEMHELFIKLTQQAIIEASEYREEVVKELLLLHSKLPIVIHEAFCVLVWRLKVLPRLLKTEKNPKATFFLYTVLFHEANAVSLLETVLYHQNMAETLGDHSLDLIDYCVQAMTFLIGVMNNKMEGQGGSSSEAQLTETSFDELQRQQEDISYKIGIKCLTILSFLIDKLECLPLSATTRLVKIHDVPCLISEILHLRPWMRRSGKGFQKFIDEKWQSVTGEDILKVTKSEAQTWFSLRQLLINQNAMENYVITEFRQREIAKCTGLLNDILLDQLPVLAELKQYLCQLQIGGSSSGKSQCNLLLEELPEIRDGIIEEAKKVGWKQIAEKHKKIFLELNQGEIMTLAMRLNSTYNTDLLAEMEGKQTAEEPKTIFYCGNCKKEAIKKCSRCQHTYYCSRDCQVKHWTIHKELCSHIQSFQ